LTKIAPFGFLRLRKIRAQVKRSEDVILAKDGRVGKINPRDWPGFLRRVVPATAWQVLLAGVSEPTDPRTRWTAKYVLLCWIAMGWSLQRPLTERFREGRALLVALFVGRRRPGGSYQGLTKATQHMGSELFGQFCQCLRWHLAGARRPG
jgi:hypothetical protein